MGKEIHSHIERATGLRPTRCPWGELFHYPFLRDLFYVFNEVESFPHRFNDSLPNRIYEGILYYKQALNRVKCYWADIDRKKSKEEEEKAKRRRRMNK